MDTQSIRLSSIFNETISYFPSITAPENVKDVTVETVLDEIAQGTYRDNIEKARSVYSPDNKADYNKLKNRLPSVTFAGQFLKRGNNDLIKSSGIALIDFDKLGANLDLTASMIDDLPYTLFRFVSPSGDGLKVGVRIPAVDNTAEYKAYFTALQNHYQAQTGFLIDQSGKDIARACFLSYDPNLYRNLDATVWNQKAESVNYQFQAPPRLLNGTSNSGMRPGDIFNQTATREDVLGLLNEMGATINPEPRHDGAHLFARPGKTLSQGIGGTVGAVGGPNHVYMFTSNFPPFKPDETYNPHAVLTFARYNGDFNAAAAALAQSSQSDAVEQGEPAFQAQMQDSNGEPRYKSISLSDAYNAEQFLYHHGHQFLHVTEWKKWLAFNGRTYDPAEKIVLDTIRSQAIERDNVARRELSAAYAKVEADLALDKDEAKKILAGPLLKAKHAKSSLNTPQIRNTATQASNSPMIAIDHHMLNQRYDLLPCLNGVINLHTGDLLRHKREYLFTKELTLAYNPNATCPRWDRFLMEIMGAAYGPESPEISEAECYERNAEDEQARELVNFLQLSLGYMLTGYVSDSHFWIYYGGGANGKTVLLATVAKIMGEFATQVPRSLFNHDGGTQHPTGLASLYNRRFVIASETNPGDRLDTALLKSMTGDDGPMLARGMREDFWSFQPTHKMILASNHLPVIRDPSDGMWRRVYFVPFNRTFLPVQEVTFNDYGQPSSPIRQDNLKDELRGEHEGILRWLVEGAVKALKDGIQAPPVVTQAVADYRKEMDLVASFIEDCCDVSSDFKVSRRSMTTAYKEWCHENSYHPMSGKAFSRDLRNRGFSDNARSGNERAWGGLHIKMTGNDNEWT